MAEISRRAGVRMATLCRTFPGGRALLGAVDVDEVDAIRGSAETGDGETPGAVLAAWRHRLFAFFAGERHVGGELLEHPDGSNPVSGERHRRVLAAGRALLVAAQHAREGRDDLTIQQILDLVGAIATIHGGPRYREPILRAALDGLRPTGDLEPMT